MRYAHDTQALECVRELAIELIPYILGERARALEGMQAGGPHYSDNQLHEQLVTEITARIWAVVNSLE